MITADQLIETIRQASDYDAHTIAGLVEDAILALNAADDGMPTLSETGPWADEDAGMICERVVDPDAQLLPEEEAKFAAEEREVAAMDVADELKHMADHYQRAHQWDLNALEYLRDAIRKAAPTMSESEIARRAGVTRMTVRKALGK